MTEQTDENEPIHGRALHDPGPGKVMPHAPDGPVVTGAGAGTTPGKEMPHTPTS